jgi:hypothetical protein
MTLDPEALARDPKHIGSLPVGSAGGLGFAPLKPMLAISSSACW